MKILAGILLLFININSDDLKPFETWWRDNLDQKMDTFKNWLGDESAISRVKAREHIKNKNYKSVLDIPSGLCTDFFGFKKDRIDIEYFAMDITEKLVEQAKKRGINCTQGNIQKISLTDNYVDVCYCRHILEHLDYYEKAINELIRVAKKEVLIVFFIKPTDKKDVIDFTYGHHNNCYNKEKFENFILQNKKVEKIEWQEVNQFESIIHIYIKHEKDPAYSKTSADSNNDMYFATSSDSKYFENLLNLIGSIHHTNYENLKEIAVFDIGLTQEQKNLLDKIAKVKVHQVEMVHPDILKSFKTNNNGKIVPGWYAWKPVVMKQALDMFPHFLYIDAGIAVLKPLNDLFSYIKQNGYFLITAGDKFENGYAHNIKWQSTKYILNKFNINEKNSWVLHQENILAGLMGAARSVKNTLILPFYEFSKDLRNFEDDGTTPDGFGTARHDQSILNLLAYTKGFKILRQDATQKSPMFLSIDRNEIPFYVTWDFNSVSDLTHLYISARFDDRFYNKFKQFIKFDKNIIDRPSYVKTSEGKPFLKLIVPKDNDWSLNSNFLNLMKNTFNSEIFIETGTLFGNSTAKAADIFNKVYTIELDKELYLQACERFKQNNNIKVYNGDSKVILKQILPNLIGNILFFLDAHWSSDLGAKGEENTPLICELKIIKDSGIRNSTIIIDDIRYSQPKYIVDKHLEKNPQDISACGYPTLDEIKKAILEINPNYKLIIYGDMAIAYTKEIELSDVIKAITTSRFKDLNEESSELIETEKTISHAKDTEKETINYLMKFKDPQIFTMHYKLWNALLLLKSEHKQEALNILNKVKSFGFNNSRISKYCDQKDTKQIIDELYKDINAIISPEERQMILQKGGNPVYGEIKYESLQTIFNDLNINQNDIFYNLGSAIGKPLVQAYLNFPFKKVAGIELSKTRFQNSMKVKEELEKRNLIDVSRKFELINQDFTESNIDDATVIYTNSACFPDELMKKITQNCSKLKTDLKVITLKILSDYQNYGFILEKEYSLPMSWTENSFYPVYVYKLKKEKNV